MGIILRTAPEKVGNRLSFGGKDKHKSQLRRGYHDALFSDPAHRKLIPVLKSLYDNSGKITPDYIQKICAFVSDKPRFIEPLAKIVEPSKNFTPESLQKVSQNPHLLTLLVSKVADYYKSGELTIPVSAAMTGVQAEQPWVDRPKNNYFQATIEPPKQPLKPPYHREGSQRREHPYKTASKEFDPSVRRTHGHNKKQNNEHLTPKLLMYGEGIAIFTLAAMLGKTIPPILQNRKIDFDFNKKKNEDPLHYEHNQSINTVVQQTAKSVETQTPEGERFKYTENNTIPPRPVAEVRSLTNVPTSLVEYDIVVFGDELESIVAAVSAAEKNDQRVALLRRSSLEEPLGGLVTRSNQTCVDRDHTNHIEGLPIAGYFEEILSRAGVAPRKFSLPSDKTASVLEDLLKQYNVDVINNVGDVIPNMVDTSIGKEIQSVDLLSPNAVTRVVADVFIDTTPDGLLFDLTNAPSIGNLQNLFPENYPQGTNGLMAVSPIPIMTNVSYADFNRLDLEIRQRGVLFDNISTLPHPMGLEPNPGAAGERSEDSAYVSRAIGLDFIRFMYQNYPQEAQSLQLSNREGAKTAILGFNVSDPKPNSIALNGFLFMPDSQEQVKQMIAEEVGPTPEMVSLLNHFQEYLSIVMKKDVGMELPENLYVRDAGEQFATTNPRTLKDLVESAVTDNTVASFSYNNDTRGQVLPALNNVTIDQNNHPVTPVLQIEADEGQSVNVENLLGVSQSIGSTPGAKGVSRIQQHLSYVAEMLGVRAYEAAKSYDGETDQVPDTYVLQEMKSRGFQRRPSQPIPITQEEQAIVDRDLQLLQNALVNTQ